MLLYEIHDCLPLMRPRSLFSAESPPPISSQSSLSPPSAWSLPSSFPKQICVGKKKGISVHQNLLQKIFSIRSHMQPKTAHFFFISPRCRLFAEQRAYKHHGNECACAYSTSASRQVGCIRNPRFVLPCFVKERVRVTTKIKSGVIELFVHRDTSLRGNAKSEKVSIRLTFLRLCTSSRLQSVKISVSTVMSNIFMSAWLSKIIMNCCWRYVKALRLCYVSVL